MCSRNPVRYTKTIYAERGDVDVDHNSGPQSQMLHSVDRACYSPSKLSAPLCNQPK